MLTTKRREQMKEWRENNKEKTREYCRKWRAKNLDKERRRCREYYANNSEQQKERNRLYYIKLWQSENAEKVRAYKRKYNKKYYDQNREAERVRRSDPVFKARAKEWKRKRFEVRSYRAAYYLKAAKKRAVQRGIPFDDKLIDILPSMLPDKCPCCNAILDYSTPKRGRQNRSPSFDRINNGGGYTVDNVAVICTRCNYIKNDATLDELKMIVAYVERELKERAEKYGGK